MFCSNLGALRALVCAGGLAYLKWQGCSFIGIYACIVSWLEIRCLWQYTLYTTLNILVVKPVLSMHHILSIGLVNANIDCCQTGAPGAPLSGQCIFCKVSKQWLHNTFAMIFMFTVHWLKAANACLLQSRYLSTVILATQYKMSMQWPWFRCSGSTSYCAAT